MPPTSRRRFAPLTVLLTTTLVAACAPEAEPSARAGYTASPLTGGDLNVIYAESFESGLAGWTNQTTSGNGTWKVLSHPETFGISSALNPFSVTLADNGAHLPASDGVNVVWFGDETGTFIGTPYPSQTAKQGGTSSVVQAGNLTSPPISLVGVSKALLQFDSWWEIEGTAAASYDLALVYISTDGTNYTELGRMNPTFAVQQPSEAAYSSGGPAAAPVMRRYIYDLSAHAGKTIRLRFRFDSKDTNYNAFRGFTVDNVIVSGGTSLPGPSLSGITPAVGTANDLVTIEGSNFQQGANFYIGASNIPFSSLTQFGHDRALFKVPSMTAGAHDVRVVNPDGQSFTLAKAFTYATTASPTVSNVTPATANILESKSLTITGTNFAAGATVTVGETAATSVTVVSATSITAALPGMEAGAYNVTVTNTTGQKGTKYAAYTVSDASTVTLTAPTTGASWQAGTVKNVTWTSSNASKVDLALFKGGTFVTNIASGVTASAGTYAWTVPSSLTAGANYQVKVSTTGGTKSSTGGNFTIEVASPVATTTTVSCVPAVATGTPTTVTATISPAATAGAVQFEVDGVAVGAPVNVANGVALSAPIAFSSGTHTISALYSGAGLSLPSSGTFSISASQTPVANATEVQTEEDVPVAMTLSASDDDGDELSWEIVSAPQHGTLQGAAPALTYVPAQDFHGQDSFTFRVADGVSFSAPATVTIDVAPVNDAPVTSDLLVSTVEDVGVAVVLTATDVDGDALGWTLGTPSHGTLSGLVPNLIYTPSANFHGVDTFQATVSDGKGGTAVSTVTIEVAAVNDAPKAYGLATSTAEDTSVSLELSATDVDGDALTFEIVSGPAHGVLTGTGALRNYAPNANFHGADSFTFRVSDGALWSSTVEVSITVTPVNDAPVAQSGSAQTDEDTAVAIELAATDVDHDALTWTVVSGPQHGTLSGTAPALTYTPAADYHGADSFTFRVSDGTADSNVATVAITVVSVNDAPTASTQSVQTPEDTTLPITLEGADVDGDTLTFEIVSGPAHGVLTGTGTGAQRAYAPNADFHGADSFTFRVGDGSLWSSTVQVSIAVTPVNDAPVAQNGSAQTDEDTAVAIALQASDVDQDALSWSIVSAPQHGILSGTAPHLTYTPAQDYHGADSFSFRVNDGAADSNVATVSISVASVNDAPVLTGMIVTLMEDATAPISMTATDADGDPLTWTVITPPSHGALSGSLPSVTYTPAQDYNGTDSFTVRVSDGKAEATATVSLDIIAVNDAPVADAQSVNVDEDAQVAITLSGSDVEGSPLSYAIVAGPSHGSLKGTPPAVTYAPDADFNGADSFTFRVSDGTAFSEVVTVQISVTPVNDAPVATAVSVTTDEDAAVEFTLAATDVDGDALSWTLLSQPTNGTLSGTAPALTYTPNADFHGEDTFQFQVSDGSLTSEAAVTVTVASVNDAPVADAQSLTTHEDESLALTLSGSDVEGDTLTFEVVDGPAHGTLTGTPPELTYLPAADFHGADRFTFKLNDGQVDSAVQEVSIEVLSVNDTPLALARAVSTSEDESVSFTVSGTDVDGDALSFRVVTQPLHGTLTGTPPQLTYSPGLNFTGTDSFTFVAEDGSATSAPAAVTIAVGPINDAPVAEAGFVETEEDTAVTFHLIADDVDGDALTWTVVTPPQHGTLTGVAPSLTYSPATHFFGEDSLTFKVNDGLADSEVVTVRIQIHSVDDAPVASPQTVILTEDLATDIHLQGSDVEGAPLTFRLVSLPQHGVITGTPPHVVYRPNLDYVGPDAFSFTVTADGVESSPAWVSITVQNSDDALAGGGLGCSATGGAAPASLLMSLLGLLLAKRRKATRRGVTAAMVASLAVAPALAAAQSLPTIDVQTLRLNVGAADGLTTSGGRLLEQGALRLSLTAHHERDPLVYFRNGERVGAIIGQRSTAHVGAAWAPLSRLELGAQLPVILSQQGDSLSQYGLTAPSARGAGTTLLHGRAALLRQASGAPLDLAVGAAVELPIGGDASVASESGVGISPSVSAGRTLNSWLRVGGEVALGLRPSSRFDDTELVRSAFEAAVLLHTTGPGLRGEVSFRGARAFDGGPVGTELRAGARHPLGRWMEVYALGGLGLGAAPGTPSFRLLAGVALNWQQGRAVAAAPAALRMARPGFDPASLNLQAPSPAPMVEVECSTEPGTASSSVCPAIPLDAPALAVAAQPLREALKENGRFSRHGTRLDEPAQATLVQYARFLQAHPEIARVNVHGFSDEPGSAAYKEGLSRARAEMVRSFLIREGVDGARIETQSHGKRRQVAGGAGRFVEIELGL